MAVVDNFQQNVGTILSQLGSAVQQVELQSEFASNLSDSIEVGIGNLVDADLSREAANLQALQVQQQLGLQAAGIANQAPGSILALFR
uniref:flagellin n=1 Tax=Iodidimonas nitroreducens TaxID=1236968 RepID=UPI0028D4FB36|nr:flagellin [Iodidimonas nitroreducens]